MPGNLSVCGGARALACPDVGSEPQGGRQWAALTDTMKLLLSFSPKNGQFIPAEGDGSKEGKGVTLRSWWLPAPLLPPSREDQLH